MTHSKMIYGLQRGTPMESVIYLKFLIKNLIILSSMEMALKNGELLVFFLKKNILFGEWTVRYKLQIYKFLTETQKK